VAVRAGSMEAEVQVEATEAGAGIGKDSIRSADIHLLLAPLTVEPVNSGAVPTLTTPAGPGSA